MLFLIFAILGFCLLVVGTKMRNYDGDSWAAAGILILIFSIVPCIGIAIRNMWTAPSIKAKIISLNAEKDFLTSLPTPVPDQSIGGNIAGAISVDIDVPNKDLGKVLVEQRIEFYGKVKAVNESLLFWQHHPKFAFWIWLAPNPSVHLADVELITLSEVQQ